MQHRKRRQKENNKYQSADLQTVIFQYGERVLKNNAEQKRYGNPYKRIAPDIFRKIS
jgi:hypothetical protein